MMSVSALAKARRRALKSIDLLGAAGRVGLGVEVEDELAPLEIGERYGTAAVARQLEVGRFLAHSRDHVPSFRRFRGANVPRDVTLVKGWRNGGVSCETGTDSGPAADAPEFEAWGLGG